MLPTSDHDAGGLPAAKVDSTSTPVSAPLASAKSFILAGKAIFTLVGASNRYTFKVQRKDASDRYPESWFVSLLTGPENSSDYTYLGMLDASSGSVRLTRQSAYNDQTTPVKAIRWAFGLIWANKALPAPGQILHAGRCGRCGRLLTVPESIASGFGPECAGRLQE
jgi:hypothetical protein